MNTLVMNPLKRIFYEEELPELVREILAELKEEHGWTQQQVAEDLALDGQGMVSQSAISQASNKAGSKHTSLQLRIIKRYREVEVYQEITYRFVPSK